MSLAPRRWRLGDRWRLRVRWGRREEGTFPRFGELAPAPGSPGVQVQMGWEAERVVTVETTWECRVTTVDEAAGGVDIECTTGSPRVEVVRLVLERCPEGTCLAAASHSTRYEWGEERPGGTLRGGGGPLLRGEGDLAIPEDFPVDFPLLYAPAAAPRPRWELPNGDEVLEQRIAVAGGLEYRWERSAGLTGIEIRQHWEDGAPWWDHHVRERVLRGAGLPDERSTLLEAWREP